MCQCPLIHKDWWSCRCAFYNFPAALPECPWAWVHGLMTSHLTGWKLFCLVFFMDIMNPLSHSCLMKNEWKSYLEQPNRCFIWYLYKVLLNFFLAQRSAWGTPRGSWNMQYINTTAFTHRCPQVGGSKDQAPTNSEKVISLRENCLNSP